MERKKNTSKLFDSKNFSSFLLLFIASIRRRLFLARFHTHKMCVLYLFWLSRKSHREQRDGEPTSADFVWFAQSAFSWCFGSKVNSRFHSSWSHFGIFARAVRRFVGRLRFWLLVRELKKNKKICYWTIDVDNFIIKVRLKTVNMKKYLEKKFQCWPVYVFWLVSARVLSPIHPSRLLLLAAVTMCHSQCAVPKCVKWWKVEKMFLTISSFSLESKAVGDSEPAKKEIYKLITIDVVWLAKKNNNIKLKKRRKNLKTRNILNKTWNYFR